MSLPVLLFGWTIFTIHGKFTTVVNNSDFVNDVADVLQTLRREAQGAGIDMEWTKDCLRLTGSVKNRTFKLVRLNRPSSRDVEREAAPDNLLVLTNTTQKALQAAKPFNHIAAPQKQYRLVAPGVVLIHDGHDDGAREAGNAPVASRQVRLMGRTGIIAETLLLNAGKEWSLQELSKAAQVSPALAHRVLTRLESEGMIISMGKGPARLRHVINPQALAELWCEEEAPPAPVLRGFLYAASLDTLAKQLLALYPQGALGGTLAANRYKPVLTRVMPPLRIWVGSDFDANLLTGTGWEETREGANVELVRVKDDPWRIHRVEGDIPMVSPWRAWLEIAGVKGRTEELASALFTDLSEDTKWK